MAKRRLKIGDRVRVLQVPPSVEHGIHPDTRSLFHRCVGHVYTVRGFDDYEQSELHVRKTGAESCREGSGCHWIWIEPEFVKIVDESDAP